MNEEVFRHEPVMPAEVLEFLRPERGGTFLDATVGGAGHAVRLLEAGPDVRVIGIDQDEQAIDAASRSLAAYRDRVVLVRGNFRDLDALAVEHDMDDLAGALLDLGVSSHQIDTPARGFSYRPGTSLRMRMGGTTGGGEPAADFLNEATEHELGRAFRDYGDERRWRVLAREVVRRRRVRPFQTSDDLVAALTAVLGRHASEREKARLFQAVRIAVNDELAALEEGLEAIRTRLSVGGRIVVIAYHSLEDRIVKHTFREWARACVCPPALPVCRCRGVPLGRVLTRRPVRPTEEEVARNPRARSARLRAWENSGR